MLELTQLEPTDRELMLATRSGDKAAFERLVLRHQDIAWKTAYRFTGDAAEAEDLAQEAFLKILDAAERYKPTASFKTYLLSVLTRLCIDHARKKRPDLSENMPDLPAADSNPREQSSRQERDDAIQDALTYLTPKQRVAVILKYFEDMSGRQTARSMGVSTKAVERLLSRARKTLEDRLRPLL